MAKAFAMISGGLDSGLAAAVVASQGIEVRCVTFKSAFFGSLRGKELAESINLPWQEIDFSTEHLAMVKNPLHGYGKNLNPCIDCHAMMIRHLARLIERDSGDFIITGEVLGQRPMSQNERSLVKVAQTSGAADILLRPLSALLLPPTPMELDGRIDRRRLLGLSGRSRKPQMELAARYGITRYPSPAGGCSLTDPGFSLKLRELFATTPECGVEAIGQLYFGRHFRLPSGIKLIIPRNAEECDLAMESGTLPGDILLEPIELTGPIGIISGEGKASPFACLPGSIDLDLESLVHSAVDEALPLFAAYLKEGTKTVSVRVKTSGGEWLDCGTDDVPTALDRTVVRKCHVCQECGR